MSHPKLAKADHDVHELVRHRWSPRAFDPTRPVAPGELMRLFEAARWTASSNNEQPWRFVVVRRDESSATWRALVAALTPGNQAWATAAPVLVVTAVKLNLGETGSPNPMAWYDVGQAMALLTVQATAQGLSARQMGGFRHEGVRGACAVPPGFDVGVVTAIGYAGDPDALALEKHRESERKPRNRKPLSETVFINKWGTGLFSTDLA
jgi:nitroreductase